MARDSSDGSTQLAFEGQRVDEFTPRPFGAKPGSVRQTSPVATPLRSPVCAEFGIE
jgi:hypothetical protein